METIKSKAGRLAPYGLALNKPEPALITMTNVVGTCPHNWGRAFETAVQTIRDQFGYDHVRRGIAG